MTDSVACHVGAGVLLLCAVVPGSSVAYADASPFEELSELGRVLARVEQSYVEPVDQKALVEGALHGMLDALDPHSEYLSEAEYRELLDDTQGEFTGVGIEVADKDGWLTALSVMKGGPAEQAGVRPGDKFLELGGVRARDMRLSEAVKLIRGKVGSVIEVVVRRDSAEHALRFRLRRALIEVDPVTIFALPDRVVYVKLNGFTDGTAAAMNSALDTAAQALSSHGGIAGLVLDLRDNAGGLVSEAVAVSNAFLASGVIVKIQSRDPQQSQTFMASKRGTRPNWPVVVLINEHTASAAEIVAGALSDAKRCVLVGRRSYGKGSVQDIVPLPSGGALKLTVARYYTRAGHAIQAKGIEPDVVVSSVDPKLVKLREENNPGHLTAEASTASSERRDKRAINLSKLPESMGFAEFKSDPEFDMAHRVLRALR